MIKNVLVITGLALLMSCHEASEPNRENKEMDESSFVNEESADFHGITVGDLSGNGSMANNFDIEPPRTTEPLPPAQRIHEASSEKTHKTSVASKAQKIIKTGNVTVDVVDLAVAKSVLDLKLKSLDAYYESENFHDRTYNLAYHLSIRVPTAGFEQLISNLDSDFGQIVSKEIHAKDVTEEYVDLGIRLESKLAALSAYRQFLKRATNVEEILNVQREIRKIEEEIESKKGRLRYLDDQAAYSTLRMTLTENRPIIAKAESRHFGQQISNAFISGYDGILNFVIAIAYVWPLWIVLGMIAIFWKRRSIKA